MKDKDNSDINSYIQGSGIDSDLIQENIGYEEMDDGICNKNCR